MATNEDKSPGGIEEMMPTKLKKTLFVVDLNLSNHE